MVDHEAAAVLWRWSSEMTIRLSNTLAGPHMMTHTHCRQHRRCWNTHSHYLCVCVCVCVCWLMCRRWSWARTLKIPPFFPRRRSDLILLCGLMYMLQSQPWGEIPLSGVTLELTHFLSLSCLSLRQRWVTQTPSSSYWLQFSSKNDVSSVSTPLFLLFLYLSYSFFLVVIFWALPQNPWMLML